MDPLHTRHMKVLHLLSVISLIHTDLHPFDSYYTLRPQMAQFEDIYPLPITPLTSYTIEKCS